MKILVIKTTHTSWMHKLPTNKEMNVKTFWDKWELLDKMCRNKHNRSLAEMIRNDTELPLRYESINKEIKIRNYNWNKIFEIPGLKVLEIKL